MPTVTVKTGELPKFDKKTFENLIEALAEELSELAEKEVKSRIKAVGAIASGQFLKSVTSDFRKQGTRNLLVSVGSVDRAAESIESGLKPTFVPLDVIFKWMKDKGIGDDPAFAYHVQQKLAMEGYEGRKVFEKAEEKVSSQIDDLVEDVLNREDFIK